MQLLRASYYVTKMQERMRLSIEFPEAELSGAVASSKCRDVKILDLKGK